MASEEMLLPNIAPQHVVQLYGRAAELTPGVRRYIFEGLKCGETCLVLATERHIAGLLDHLAESRLNPLDLQREARLIVLDAQKTLAKFIVDGKPHARLFDSCVGTLVRDLSRSKAPLELRAYGEMVGLLWLNGQFSAAMALEELWNDLLQCTRFNLFCSYPIDVFDRAFHRCDVDAVMCSHTHLVPFGFDGDLESAVSRAMDDTIGARNGSWRAGFQAADKPEWGDALKGEALILWIRETFSESADDILIRARAYFEGAPEYGPPPTSTPTRDRTYPSPTHHH